MAKPIRYIKVNGIKKPIYADDENGNPICGRVRPNGTVCTRPAGDGTKHPGYGRCAEHGGKSESKPGNRAHSSNGMKSTVWQELLDPMIIEYWDDMRTDTLEQVQNEIKLCDARIYYLLSRIKELINEKEGFVTIEKTVDNYKQVSAHREILVYQRALDAVQARKMDILKVKVKLEDSDPELGNIDNMMSLVNTLNESKNNILKFKEARENDSDQD
jgi:hypothetical protein